MKSRSKLARYGTNIALAVAAIVIIIAVWNAVIWIFGLKPFVLPTPQSAASDVVHNWSTLAPLTFQTVKETVEGFVL